MCGCSSTGATRIGACAFTIDTRQPPRIYSSRFTYPSQELTAMANPEHLEVLKEGVEAWNIWRGDNPSIKPDLRGVDLEHQYLDGINFEDADLRGANLFLADFRGANFKNAQLSNQNFFGSFDYADFAGANLWNASLGESSIEHANFEGAELNSVSFQNASLNNARFRFANLAFTNFDRAVLDNADFSGAKLYATIFGSNDLSVVNGLDEVTHDGPSTVGLNTLYRSGGKISEVFLRGCGVPEPLIVQIPALVAALGPIQFYSCFISYSHADKSFARRLHDA